MLTLLEAIILTFDYWKEKRRLAVDDVKSKLHERYGICIDENDLWRGFSHRNKGAWPAHEMHDWCIQHIASFQHDFEGEGIEFFVGRAWTWLREALSTSTLCGYIALEGDCLVSVPHQFWTSTRADSAASTDMLDFSVWDREFRAEVLIDRAELVEVLAGRAVVSKRPQANFNSIPPTPVVNKATEALQERVSVGRGRPAKFDWVALWIEVCRYLYLNGIPSTQAALIKHLQQWASDRFGEEPAETTLKPVISRFLREMRDFEQKSKDD
jgi:hypothetical protein